MNASEQILSEDYKPKIFIFQDCNCKILSDYLEYRGYQPIIAKPDSLVFDVRECKFDLCILDSYEKVNKNQPFRLAEIVRAVEPKMPIIFISRHVNHEFIIQAFRAGVDDYIARPYNMEELTCRMHALLRCYNLNFGLRSRQFADTYKLGSFEFNSKTLELSRGKAKMILPYSQGIILALLCAYRNRILDKKIIFQNLWQGQNNFFIRKSLDAHLCYLRRTLAADKRIRIVTIVNEGYKLIIEGEEENKE